MSDTAFQDAYPEALSHCYGCGSNNDHGLQLKSYWDGDETIATYTPRPEHTAIPNFVYGGLLASIIDCHGTGSASAAATKEFGIEGESALRFVTANLNVDFLAPTPMGVELEARGTIRELKEKKVIVDMVVSANGKPCAKGTVIAVRMPDSMLPND